MIPDNKPQMNNGKVSLRNKVFVLLICFIIIGLDQFTKMLVKKYIPLGGTIDVWQGVFDLTHTTNTGVAFGLLQNRQSFVLFSSIIAIVLIVLFLFKIQHNMLSIFGLGLTLGGALGNMIDRIFLGKVTDFLNFAYWPTFNVADSAVVVGFFLLALFLIRGPANSSRAGERADGNQIL
ncbi:MAG: signal peptidase II [Actinobacteria bacterium]|nr:signal peptidase II [Actinomycetota bacterium]